MAVENGVQNAELGYLLFPFEQYSNLAGKPLVGGHMEIYEAGTDTKYISYQNWDGAENPFKIPLPADGRITVLADPTKTFDCYLYDSYNNLVCSRLNVQCCIPGNISIKGADTILKNTDGTLDIYLRTLGNNVREYTVNTHNKILDVQEPLYFVENSNTATVIGFSGDGYVTEDKFEYDANDNITGYNNSAFASNGQTYSAGTNIDITDNVISVTGLPTSSDVENAISSAVTNVENKFEYNENDYITAYNSSAFAGTNYSAGDYVSIENDTISVTGLQPSGDYATKTELESATSGKMDVTGMTAYQPTGDYATHDDLTAYQPAGDYYSASNPSGFITNDAITGLQPSGDYYSASNPSGFITNDAITGLQPSGDYATHDDLTAYATTALVSSVSSELYSAFSGISGDFELVAGSGVELVDDPNAKTTTINVTAEGTPVTAIQLMIESATSGKADTSRVVEYNYKPESGAIYASYNTLANVGVIQGSGNSNFCIVPSSVLQVPNIITAHPNGFTANSITAYNDSVFGGFTANGITAETTGLKANGLSADSNGFTANGISAYNNSVFGGFTANGITANANNSAFEANGISAGKRGPLYIEGQHEIISAYGGFGFIFSSQNTAFGTAMLTTAVGNQIVQDYSPKFEARNTAGAGFSIEASGAKGYDHNGNVTWDTTKVPLPNRLISFAATQPAILISPTQSSQSGYAPYVSADYNSLSISYGPTASTPHIEIKPDNITTECLTSYSSRAQFGLQVAGVQFENDHGIWTLTGSVQKREIECDTATSAITAIAGSAIGGGGGVAQSAFDELKQSYDALSALFATYSGQWLLPNEGEE